MFDREVDFFLSMVTKFCNGIINFELYVIESDISTYIFWEDIIKSQPLERMIFNGHDIKFYTKKIIDTLEFRSETLKELEFVGLNFQGIDLSFISRFGCLKRLKIDCCEGFTYGHKKNLCLKELSISFRNHERLSVVEGLFDILYSEALL